MLSSRRLTGRYCTVPSEVAPPPFYSHTVMALTCLRVSTEHWMESHRSILLSINIISRGFVLWVGGDCLVFLLLQDFLLEFIICHPYSCRWTQSEDTVNSHLNINTLRPRQNGRHFPDDIFKSIFFKMKMHELWLRFHWNLFLRVHLAIFQHIDSDNGLAPARCQADVWNNDGLFTDAYNICVTRSQWVKPGKFQKSYFWYFE